MHGSAVTSTGRYGRKAASFANGFETHLEYEHLATLSCHQFRAQYQLRNMLESTGRPAGNIGNWHSGSTWPQKVHD